MEVTMETKLKPAITSFSGKHAFLSNFHLSHIIVDGIVFPTVEHAFQAAKTRARSEKKAIASLPTPGQAKRAGRHVALRPNWDEIKVNVMRELLKKKFAPGTELAQKLLDTDDRDLIEGNTWGDRFWGMVKVNRTTPWDGDREVPCWEGENHLGKLLMEIRDELREAV
jgi:ribA/ribD-fused uncharacterized protein